MTNKFFKKESVEFLKQQIKAIFIKSKITLRDGIILSAIKYQIISSPMSFPSMHLIDFSKSQVAACSCTVSTLRLATTNWLFTTQKVAYYNV